MQAKLKQTGLLLLLLTAAVPALIVAGLLLKQKTIQWDMEEQLNCRQLETLTVDAADINWIKKDKEAEINGRLFDIKKIEVSGTKIILTGLYDSGETDVKKELSGIYKQQKDHSSPVSKLVVKFFSTTLINQILYSNNSLTAMTGKPDYCFYADKLLHRSAMVTSPPPNV